MTEYGVIYDIILHYTMLYYTIPYWTVLYYVTLYYTMLYYTTRYDRIRYGTILYYALRYYNVYSCNRTYMLHFNTVHNILHSSKPVAHICATGAFHSRTNFADLRNSKKRAMQYDIRIYDTTWYTIM